MEKFYTSTTWNAERINADSKLTFLELEDDKVDRLATPEACQERYKQVRTYVYQLNNIKTCPTEAMDLGTTHKELNEEGKEVDVPDYGFDPEKVKLNLELQSKITERVNGAKRYLAKVKARMEYLKEKFLASNLDSTQRSNWDMITRIEHMDIDLSKTDLTDDEIKVNYENIRCMLYNYKVTYILGIAEMGDQKNQEMLEDGKMKPLDIDEMKMFRDLKITKAVAKNTASRKAAKTRSQVSLSPPHTSVERQTIDSPNSNNSSNNLPKTTSVNMGGNIRETDF